MQAEAHNSKHISSDQRRFLYLVKGAAIFLMLYGHCIQYCSAESGMDFFENPVFKTIYTFHMPLFMLVSGYLFHYSFEKYSMGELLVRRVQGLVQPIVFCSIFSFLLTDVAFDLVTGTTEGIWDGRWLEKLPSMWFLWSALSATVAVTLVCKHVQHLCLQIPLLALMTLFVAFFPNATENVFMYPYFLLGFYFARYRVKLPLWVYRLRYLTLILFPAMVCVYEKKHYIYISGLKSPGSTLREAMQINGFRWGIGLVGAVFALTVLEYAFRKGNTAALGRFLLGGLMRLGEKSLQIYALSIPLLSAFLSYAFPLAIRIMGHGNFFARSLVLYNFVFTPILAIVYAAGLYFAVYLLEKSKVSRLMFGR